jgi:hypothetical protein
VAVVFVSYGWLYAYAPDTLGWIYSGLRPVTIWLYGLIDTRLPEAVKYKVSAGLSDEFGQRALLLLILAGLAETVVLGLWRAVTWLFRSGD